MPVYTPSSDYEEMVEHWKLPVTLMGGTPAMREMEEEYLPKHPKETREAYEVRLKQAVLYNFFKKTIQSLVGQSFIRNVVITNVPKELEYLENNMDGAHTTATDFAAELLKDTLVYGKSHDYTDFPRRTEETSLKEFREFKAYASKLDPRNVIGWRVETVNGHEELTEVRIREYELRIDDDWEEELVERIKVVTKEKIVIYKQVEIEKKDITNGDLSVKSKIREIVFEPVDEIPNTLGYIPINVTYGGKTGFYTSRSPLEDMAYLNLRHYQSTSDQAHILHVARVPFLFGAGFEEGELEDLEIGPNRMVVSDNADAKLNFVEHTGAAIEAGRNYEKDLISSIAMLGADILMTSGNRADRQTALAASIDSGQSLSIIQIMLRGIEESIKNIYKTAGDYMRVEGADKVMVTINDSMGLPNDPNPVQSVVSLLEALNLTGEDITRELKRRGLLSPAVQSVALKRDEAKKAAETPDEEDQQEVEDQELEEPTQ